MFNILATLMLAVLCFGNTKQIYIPRVETKVGAIRGTHRTSETGKDIFSFTGIPYIEPPIGKLRFKPPVPAKPFTKDFNATKDDALCPQYLYGKEIGKEDCVILSVHTPWNPSSRTPVSSLPVMMFIHGGGFITGSSITTVTGMPDYLLNYDVILVTINYRLGVLGFLSTGDEEASGNYGLLDQVEALKWIKNNIAAFGGDADKVTIFGESAGGSSVHFLMLSPLAKGLFHQAIAQSGTALNPWTRTSISERNTNVLAEKLNCSVSRRSEMLECLRKKDAMELVMTDVIEKDKRSSEQEPCVWVPRIDSEASSPFLPLHPIDIMISGEYNKVPLLLGHNKDEGASLLSYSNRSYEESQWDNRCKVDIGSREFRISEEKGTQMCNRITEHYFDHYKTFKENKLQYVKLFGDIMIVAGVYKAIQLMADQMPMYSYLLTYDNGRVSLMGTTDDASYQHSKGVVTHMDDLLYLFKFPQTNWTTQSPPYQIINMMTKIWTDFAKTGKPKMPGKGEWPRATTKKSKYVVLDISPHVEEDYRPKDMEFMNGIFNETVYNTLIGKEPVYNMPLKEATKLSLLSPTRQLLLLPIMLTSLIIVCVVYISTKCLERSKDSYEQIN